MTAKKKTAKKTAKKTTTKKNANVANDAPDLPPLPPSMPGMQEIIVQTLDEAIPAIQEAAKDLDLARKASAGWGRQAQARRAALESHMKEHGITNTYYDGVVRVSVTVASPREKLEVEVIEAHLPEAAE